MLVSQLCAFDDESDSKSKWVKKHILWLCCPKYLVYLWVKISISICDMVVVQFTYLFNYYDACKVNV